MSNENAIIFPTDIVHTNENTKFFHFDQNNSGGSFYYTDDLTENVYIEALNAEDANDRAERIGIYFDGCEIDRDCSCCGDRWYHCYSDEDGKSKVKLIESIINCSDHHWSNHGNFAIVHHLDGKKTKFFLIDGKIEIRH